MLIGGGVIIKVFLISPAHLVRLRTLSGFAACPGTHLVRVRTRPRVLYPRVLPIQNVVMSSFARPSLALRSPFARPSLNYSQQKFPKIALHFFSS